MSGTLRFVYAALMLLFMVPASHAQDETRVSQAKQQTNTDQVENLGTVEVVGHSGYANAQYDAKNADIGPLGRQALLDTPFSVTVVPDQFIVNQQAKTVNSVLRSLPSVEIRDQQGLQVSRPQSRGFEGTVVQNVRLDGLNIIGTTAIPAENLSSVQVLNGLAGSLYGPETPAGVFNYVLKRPPRKSLLRYTQSFDSDAVLTEHLDFGGRAGADGRAAYRFNLVHGEGQGYVSDSNTNRTLLSGGFDYHFDDRTVIETNVSHYESRVTGLPGSIVYGGGNSTLLPTAVDPTRKGLGQPGAGNDLMTNTALVRIKHDFDNGWHFEVGGLYQDAIRNLFGITNRFINDRGDFDVIKNFNAIARYTILSNMARLNGHFNLSGMRNDLTIATNGFDNGRYSRRNSIATPLGSANISNPVIFPAQPIPNGGGKYKSGVLREQSAIVGDTIHVNSNWAVQGVLSTSFISARSYAEDGRIKKSDSRNGVLSPTVSLIYTPTPGLTTYATYAESTEEGRAAPAGTANANDFLAPYHDTEYEAGAKYAVSDRLLVTLGAFRMTRPLASTNPSTNVFAIVGTQRNYGVELFAQGSVTPQISILGGVTYVDARLIDTGRAATDNSLVIGVPHIKSDISVDYHPDFAPGYALTGALHVESRRAATITNNSFAPGYATFDLGLRYSTRLLTHYLTLRLQVINVTDVHYYSAVAGGNIVGSAGANTAYFGAPRTVRASLELDF